MTDETLTARLARLQHPDIDPTHLLYELLRAYESDQLIALDVPANGEAARIWADEPDIFDGAGIWDDDEDRKGRVSHAYIAQSAIRSALLAADVKGLLDAAAWCDDYQDNAPGWGEDRNAAVAEQAAKDCAIGIRAIAATRERTMK